MASDIDRRQLLKNGLRVGIGMAIVGFTSSPISGRALAASDAPASQDAPDNPAPEQFGWAYCSNCQGMFTTHLNPGESVPMAGADMASQVI